MAQNTSPHYLCDYSAITIADKDAGITNAKAEYLRNVEAAVATKQGDVA